MSDEREYWRSAIVGRVNEQQPIYAGELLDELADLRAQNAERDRRIAELETELRRWRGCPSCKEDHDDSVMCPPHEVRTSGRAWFHTQARRWAERAEQAEFERDNLRDTCIDYEAKIDGLVAERDNWQETARQAYRNVDYYRGLVVSIGELFGQEARTSDDGSIQDDVLCAKVPELCTTMRVERDQLAAECVMLREAVNVALDTEESLCGSDDRIVMYEQALATTPHAAKAAEAAEKCPNPNCINGAEDTGGVTPWDEPILIPCPACQDRKREKA